MRLVAFAALVLLNVCTHAKNTTPNVLSVTNLNAWYMYFGNHRISENWGLHAEAQLRRNGIVEKPQQLLLRGGVHYYANESTLLTAGYGYIYHSPYGEAPAATAFPEHRLWEQVQLSQRSSIFALTHRFRLEQRFLAQVQNNVINSWRTAHRVRYLFRANMPFIGETIDDNELYLGVYNEIFLNFGANVDYKIFDQNRIYAAIGYQLSGIGRVEAGYLNQYSMRYAANLFTFEQNHTLQLALFCSVPLSGK